MTTLTRYELINLDEEREHEHEAAPCPFCKSERVEFVTDRYSKWNAVMCVTCDARGPAKREYAQAVDGWNAVDRCLAVTPVANADTLATLQARLKLAEAVIDVLSHGGQLQVQMMTDGGKAWREWTR